MSDKKVLNVYVDEQGNLQVYDELDKELLFICKDRNELWDEMVNRNCGVYIKGKLSSKL